MSAASTTDMAPDAETRHPQGPSGAHLRIRAHRAGGSGRRRLWRRLLRRCDLPAVAPQRSLGAAQSCRSRRTVQLHRRCRAGVPRRPAVHARRRQLVDHLDRHRPCHHRRRLSGLGDGGQILLADRHAAGDHGARRADRAGRACRRAVGTRRRRQHRHRGHAARRRVHRRADGFAARRLGRPRLRRRHRRHVRLHPGRTRRHLPDGPDHRRRGDQPVRARIDILCLEPGVLRVPLPEQRAGVPVLQDPAARRHSGDRAGAVQPEPVRLWRDRAGRGGDLLPVLHTLRPARARRSASIRALPTRSASTSTAPATSM